MYIPPRVHAWTRLGKHTATDTPFSFPKHYYNVHVSLPSYLKQEDLTLYENFDLHESNLAPTAFTWEAWSTPFSSKSCVNQASALLLFQRYTSGLNLTQIMLCKIP